MVTAVCKFFVCVCGGGGRGTGLGEKSECHIKGTAIYGLYGNVPL